MTPDEIQQKAEQLAKEWHNTHSEFFQKLGVEFSWAGLGLISQEYWKECATK